MIALYTNTLTTHLHCRHFCRHDNAAGSDPILMLMSFAAMFCDRLPGYKEQLKTSSISTLKEALSKGVEDVFECFVLQPLSKMARPAGDAVYVLVIDALDELPADAKNRVLSLITEQFTKLVPWIKVFLTSRNEASIHRALAKTIKPNELLVDAEKNQQDMRAYVGHFAREFFAGFNAEDLKTEVLEKFEVTLDPALLQVIKENTDLSVAAYDEAMAGVLEQDSQGVAQLLEVADLRPPDRELKQNFKSFEEAMKKSKKAREVMMKTIALKWKVVETIGSTKLSRPVFASAHAWFKNIPGLEVLEPGLKSQTSAQRKVDTEYGGDYTCLKDVARMSFTAETASALIEVLTKLQRLPGWKLMSCKNKYANPTPLGYRDLNTCFKVFISETDFVLCEVQFHLNAVLQVKHHAHAFYEVIRVALPKIGEGNTNVQAYVKSRLDNSALDAAVEKIEEKAGGLFIYASLLHSHMKSISEKTGGKLTLDHISALPGGLDEIYHENFQRVFPEGVQDKKWDQYSSLVALIVAAKSSLPTALVKVVNGWTDQELARVLSDLSLLFPVRDGKIHVLHKTVVDWLVKKARMDLSYYISPEDTADAHQRLARTCLKLIEDGQGHEPAFLEYPVKFALAHACEVGAQQHLRDRAVAALLNFEYLYACASISPVKLLEDARSLEQVMSTHAPDENERGRAVSLVRSALHLALQGLLLDYR